MSIDEAILKKLWKQLWQKDSAYYLPNIMSKGFNQENIKIDQIEGTDLGKLGPISLIQNFQALGELSIVLDNDKVNGLGGITKGDFHYKETTHTLTLGINFPKLKFSGNYYVIATPLISAMHQAAGLLSTFANRAYVKIPDLKENNDHEQDNISNSENFNKEYDKPIDQQNCTKEANEYKKRLKESPTGIELDKIYEGNNCILNTIFATPSYFTQHVWPSYKTNGKNTNYFANQTYVAAKTDSNSTEVVNDKDYNFHSLYVHQVLIGTTKQMQRDAEGKGDEIKKSQCTKLLDDMDTFFKNTVKAGYGNKPNPVKVDQIMQYIQETTPEKYNANKAINDLDLSPETLHIIEKAKQDMQKWIDIHGSLIIGEPYDNYFTSFVEDSSNFILSGNFEDKFENISGNLTVGITTNKNDTPSIDKVAINLNIENITISLTGDKTTPVFNAVTNAIANSNCIKSLVKMHIINGINSQDDSLKSIFNEALSQL